MMVLLKMINVMASRKYSRQQAIAIAESTSSRLAYYDRVGLVVPEKIGDSKKPVVLYSEKQIEQLKLINSASGMLSLDCIRTAIKRDRLAQVVEALTEALK